MKAITFLRNHAVDLVLFAVILFFFIKYFFVEEIQETALLAFFLLYIVTTISRIRYIKRQLDKLLNK